MNFLRPLTLALLTSSMLGCFLVPTLTVGGEGNSLAQENSRLREADAALKKELVQVQARLKASEVENSTLRKYPAGLAAGPEVVMPMATSIELDGLSGIFTKTNTLHFYVIPRDQEQRILPIVGKAQVRLLEGDKEIAAQAWDMKAFNGAWSDNLTGTYYRLEMLVPANLPAAWQVEIEVQDLATGVVMKAREKFPR